MESTTNACRLLADLDLARRLEMAEARANAMFVDSRMRDFPEANATWIEVGGAYAMFDGVGSPLTQTFGLGIHQEISSSDLDTIEDFFLSRGSPVYHEVSPLAPMSLVDQFVSRGYRPVEYTNVLYQDLNPPPSFRLPNPLITVRTVACHERAAWAKISATGWSELGEFASLIQELALVSAGSENAVAMVAELDGKPIATGLVILFQGVALLAGASTIPEARRQGAQFALLSARLQLAVSQGCDLAAMCALPGSPSQRNAQRNGFQVAYTRTKWRLQANP